MRQLFVAIVAAVATVGLAAGNARADKVEVKGPHICCGQCIKAVSAIREVDGVSDVKSAAKSDEVTFTAKDEKAAVAGVKALIDSGFFGTAKQDGKELKVETRPSRATRPTR